MSAKIPRKDTGMCLSLVWQRQESNKDGTKKILIHLIAILHDDSFLSQLILGKERVDVLLAY